MLNEGFKYMENNLTTDTGSEVTLLTTGSPQHGGRGGKFSSEDPSSQDRILSGNISRSQFNNSRKVALVISRTLLAGFQGRSAFCLVRRTMRALH